MALIEVETNFDPATRPAAFRAAWLKTNPGHDELTEEAESLVEGVSAFFDGVFPEGPVDVADYLQAVGDYLAMVVVSIGSLQQKVYADLEPRIVVLED